MRSHLATDDAQLLKATWWRLPLISGVLTAVAAGSGSAGHVAVARYTNPDLQSFHVHHMRLFWQTLVGPVAEQEIRFSAFKLTAYPVAHTGGTAVAAQPRHPSYAGAPAATGLVGRVATTGALTAPGTPATIAAAPFMTGYIRELAAAANVHRGFIDEEEPSGNDPHPLEVLDNETGILVRCEEAMGSGLTGRLWAIISGWER